jgi:hypothetical protein
MVVTVVMQRTVHDTRGRRGDGQVIEGRRREETATCWSDIARGTARHHPASAAGREAATTVGRKAADSRAGETRRREASARQA